VGLLFEVSSSGAVCAFLRSFFLQYAYHVLVLTLCYLEQYEVDTISSDIVKTLHVIVCFFFFVKRNSVCESKFS
jgi:hypothetical protein